MFNSRMWSIGWNPTTRPKTSKKGAGAASLKSVPGRTPRLRAINLLQIAAEIEHALMAQYLYAAYSINEQFAEGRDDFISSTISRWKRDICTVARQEMTHLITVQNLLLALGTDLYLNRENNFELHSDEYPFPVCFEPLSLKSLAKYVVTENPEVSQIRSQSERESLRKASRLLRTELHKKHLDFQDKINRVGVIYLTLYWLFLRTDDSKGLGKLPSSFVPCMKDAELLGVHLDDSDFVTLSDFKYFEATPAEWHIYEREMKVSNTDPRSNALAAIHWIMAQGEGSVGMKHPKTTTTRLSHFQIFGQIFNNFYEKPSQYRGAIFDVRRCFVCKESD
jgi:Ferritin-like